MSLTVAQMKARLAEINPHAHHVGQDDSFVAGLIAKGAAAAVNAVASAKQNTIDFVDAVSTGYQYQRALNTGVLAEPVSAPARKAKATPKATPKAKAKATPKATPARKGK